MKPKQIALSLCQKTGYDEKLKKQIDEMDYESMLSLWRYANVGHPMFQGEIGDYYSKVMHEKSAKISDSERVAASKSVGWK